MRKAGTGRTLREAAVAMERRCTFAAFQRAQALLMPLGAALTVASFAALRFGALVPLGFGADGQVIGAFLDGVVRIVSKDFVDTDYAQGHVVSMLLFLIVLVAGILVLRCAHDQRDAFREVHPYLDDKADPGELAEARRRGIRFMLAAGALALAGVASHVLTRPLLPAGTFGPSSLFNVQASPLANVVNGLVTLMFAGAVFLFMRGYRVAEAPSYLAYNLDALTERSVYSVGATEDEGLREVLLAAKGILDAGLLWGRLGLAACVILSACLFFLPTLETPLWWAPLIIGLIFRDAMVAAAVNRCKRNLGPTIEHE